MLTTHGLSDHRLYLTWNGMRMRCYDATHKHYASYGGRGITVCERWHDVANFVADMNPSYVEGLQLDRIDNNGNYEPDNCRWATQLEQHGNKRNNYLMTFNGKTQHAAAWAREIGLPTATVSARISKGWSVEKILTPFPLTCSHKPLLRR